MICPMRFKQNKICIVHFQPLELYPPAMNFITTVANQSELKGKISVLTTKNRIGPISYSKTGVVIKRLPQIVPSSNKLLKLFQYCFIYCSFTLHLLYRRPKVVVYFETLSALPVIFYYFLCRKKKKPMIYIHYHEIVTLDELSQGRWLNKKINSLEKRIYKHATWISQTNAQRLELFQEQYDLDGTHNRFHILPNYPPYSWLKAPKHKHSENANIIKLVHIGALSTKSMYLENILEFVGNNPKFMIDFYSHKFTQEISQLLSHFENCHIKGSIAYVDIPKLKGLYDVGLVMYNGSSLNFTYNAPNKIFEYLALDLDVWCSDKLITARDHERLDCYPKMIMVDYEKLQDFAVEKGLNKDGLEYIPSPYFCEPVYETLLKEIEKGNE